MWDYALLLRVFHDGSDERLTELLRDRICALAAAGLFAAAVTVLAPKGSGKKVVGVVCTLFLLAVLMQPSEGLHFERYAELLSEQRAEGERIAGKAAEDTQSVYALCIREKTEAYIWNKAKERGVALSDVRVTMAEGREYPYPQSVTLGWSGDEAERRRLGRIIEGELGVPEERQAWYVGNGGNFGNSE